MQRLTRCMVLLGAVGALSAVSGCASGDPTDNNGTPTEIVSNPDVVFVDQGQTQPVVVSVVDEDGQALEADFTVDNIGAGITVTPDPDFQPVTGPFPLRRQARFFVQAVDLTATTFRVSALGLSKDVQVTSVPASLAAVFSNATPALGDTITITAPAGTFFSQTSAISFGVQDLVITDRAADGSVITFIPAPTIHGPLTVTEVNVTSDPDLSFTLSTTETLITDSLVVVPATFSNQTPALGETVTLTLPATLKVDPLAAADLTIAAAALPPRDIVVAADSGSIAFVPAPNSDSVAVIPGVFHFRLPMYPLILPTTLKVTTPVVTDLPSTLSSATPAVNVPVVLTSTNASFTFVDPAVVGVGADFGAIVTGQTASTITFLPKPASAGIVSVESVDVAGFGLALPSTAGGITTGSTVPSLPGTDSPATAPALVLPAVGGTTGIYDSGPFAANIATIGPANRVYRIVAPGASSYTVTVDWDNAATDVDLALCGEITCATPDFSGATADHPESTTYTFTGAGTNYLVVNLFAGDVPGWISIAITRDT
jgi:hypothetical protein